ncbi:MAG: hypothetical protein J1F60_03910 [Oscillospiraceae bacterium]|nr:hypothetical protein [Oscillospiraceae bacterium]
MDILSELDALGVNTKEAIERLNNNSAFYIRMLGKFTAELENHPVMPYLESGDKESAVAHAHTLKGLTGNLSVTPLYKAYTEIVALLRADELEKARQLMADTLPIQSEIVACISKYNN